MAHVFQFKAPDSLELGRDPERDLEAYAKDMAERSLEVLGDNVPIGINAVSVAKPDVEVWVQWTRACCDSRQRIEDFEEPVVADLDVAVTKLPVRMHNTHIESQLRTVRLEGADHVAE